MSKWVVERHVERGLSADELEWKGGLGSWLVVDTDYMGLGWRRVFSEHRSKNAATRLASRHNRGEARTGAQHHGCPFDPWEEV
jgi:hypothetical protein